MSREEYNIEKVSDNKAKGLSYKENFSRYNKAKKSEFYLECLWILYAMIEDRTSAFLYYIGFTSESKRASATGSKKIKKDIRSILRMEQTNAKYKFNTLSGKFERIQRVLEWSKAEEADTEYKKALIKQLKPVAEDADFLKVLLYLNGEWRDKRNQLTHALFIKNTDSVLAELKSLVEKGYNAARQLDNATKKLKKMDIRKEFKIQ